MIWVNWPFKPCPFSSREALSIFLKRYNTCYTFQCIGPTSKLVFISPLPLVLECLCPPCLPFPSFSHPLFLPCFSPRVMTSLQSSQEAGSPSLLRSSSCLLSLLHLYPVSFVSLFLLCCTSSPPLPYPSLSGGISDPACRLPWQPVSRPSSVAPPGRPC